MFSTGRVHIHVLRFVFEIHYLIDSRINFVGWHILLKRTVTKTHEHRIITPEYYRQSSVCLRQLILIEIHFRYISRPIPTNIEVWSDTISYTWSVCSAKVCNVCFCRISHMRTVWSDEHEANVGCNSSGLASTFSIHDMWPGRVATICAFSAVLEIEKGGDRDLINTWTMSLWLSLFIFSLIMQWHGSFLVFMVSVGSIS